MNRKVIFKLGKPFDGILDMARYGSERTYSKHVVSGSVNEGCLKIIWLRMRLLLNNMLLKESKF
jgi:hypothetical protein